MFFSRHLRQPKVVWRRHTNPDGSEGGRVASTAEVGRNVTIRKTALVLPGARVPDDAVLELGVVFTPEGPIKFTK